MIWQPSASRWAFSVISSLMVLVLCHGASAAQSRPVLSSHWTQSAFPGAQGWAAGTPGGRGGQVIKVTTLAAARPGSLRAAIEAKGPRIVVFEVGGVIDLDRETLQITEPFITIAGQTAPSPGITIIRAGGVAITTHDVVFQHLRLRPGDAGQPKAGGWSSD